MEFLAIGLALAVTLVVSNTLLSPASPAVNTGFIAQMGSKVQTFVANTLNSINQAQTQTATGQAPEAGTGPAITITQDQDNKVTSVTFQKAFAYKLENGIYR